MSIRNVVARHKAKDKGAWAGRDDCMHFWSRSKRELIEAALHLASVAPGARGDRAPAVRRLDEEFAALHRNGLL